MSKQAGLPHVPQAAGQPQIWVIGAIHVGCWLSFAAMGRAAGGAVRGSGTMVGQRPR
jgi:hypothetical protein